jgi:hypothetical protein
MADDEGSNHKDKFENQADQPVKSLRDYLQPTRSNTPSCMAVPANIGNFDIKPGVVQLLPKFRTPQKGLIRQNLSPILGKVYITLKQMKI